MFRIVYLNNSIEYFKSCRKFYQFNYMQTNFKSHDKIITKKNERKYDSIMKTLT